MKNLLLILASVWIFSSCSDENKDYSYFLETYKQILIERESGKDSVLIQENVMKIIDDRYDNEKQFQEEFFRYGRSKEFVMILDSLRNTLKREEDSIKAERDSIINSKSIEEK